ncbi:MAG: hypothetical protein IJ457_03000 [Clostridia bacterium]|nr:hypothetical protein [Clostridia bacterium]
MNYNGLLSAIFEMTFVSSVIALVVILIRRSMGKLLAKGLMFVLWSVVILKLLIPLNIPSPLSVYNVVDVDKLSVIETSAQLPVVEITNSAEQSIPIQSVPTAPVADAQPQLPALPVTPSQTVTPSPTAPILQVPEPEEVPPSVYNEEVVAPETHAGSSSRSVDVAKIIGVVYCTVAIIGLTAVLISYAVTAYRVSKAKDVTDERILGILSRLPKGEKLRVRMICGNRSIMIFGIFRPVIVVPEDHSELTDNELYYLLMHEYQHYRHLDLVWNVLMHVAVCLHWFNPLVYIVRRLFLCDMETACDSRVLRELGQDEKIRFAEVLVSFAQRNSSVFSVSAMGFGKRYIKRRVTAAVKYKKTGIVAAAVSVLLVAVVIVVFATGENKMEKTVSTDTEAISSEEEPTAAVTEEDTAEKAESEPAETNPEEIESTADTTVVPEAEPVEIVKTDLASWRACLEGLDADTSGEIGIQITDAEELYVFFDANKAPLRVEYGGKAYPLEFGDSLSAYSASSNFDIVIGSSAVSVGLRGRLGTYYIFTNDGYTKLSRDASVGYYVWSDSNELYYMKQALAFEYASLDMNAFSKAYSSPDSFYMDHGRIVLTDDGKLGFTKTSVTVQDYFMSDSFMMAAERDKYAYDSVDEFVADYNSGTIGVPPTLTYSVDTLDLGSSSDSVRDIESYNEACERLRDYIISRSDNAAGEVNRAVRIGSKGEFDSFVSAVNSFSPDLLQSFDTSKYSEAFFADSAVVVIAVFPDDRIDYNITLEQAVLAGTHLSFEIQRNLQMYIELYEPDWSSYRPVTPHPLPFRYSSKYPYSLFFVSMNRDAFEYADSLSINEYRSITPMEYLYKNGEYQWTESYRNEPFKAIIRCGSIESNLKASADNIDKLGSYENQFPIKVFETYNELYDFITGISFYELNMDPLYQLIEHYDHRYFENNVLVLAIGSEKREKDITEDTDVEFYYEIVNGKMTVYVHDLTGQSTGRKYLRFYNIPHSNLAGVTEFACQYDAATLGEDIVNDTDNGEIQPIDPVEVYNSFDNPYGNDTPADLSQYMYKPSTVQPSTPVIPLYSDPAPKVTFPTVSG